MRNPPVLRIDRNIARCALTLAAQCCGQSVLPDGRAELEVRRAGSHGVLARYRPLEVDDVGRLVFAWDARLLRAAPGLYDARLTVDGVRCGQVVLQLGTPCDIAGAENIARSPCCANPDDPCNDCGCDPLAEPARDIYTPPYKVKRGC